MCEISRKLTWGFKDEVDIFVVFDVSKVDDLFEAFKVLKVHSFKADRVFFFEGLDF